MFLVILLWVGLGWLMPQFDLLQDPALDVSEQIESTHVLVVVTFWTQQLLLVGDQLVIVCLQLTDQLDQSQSKLHTE